jgi:flagellar M-ring protein FliF
MGSLSPARRIVILLVGGGTLLGIVALVVWANKIDYQPLYFNLSPEDAGAVVSELKNRKVSYRLSGDGNSILVPSGLVYDLRLALASKGLPQGGGVGFEIFDRSHLGTTEFVQKINYRRALQGELARTINEFAEVEQSRVHVTIPERSLFTENEEKARASVVLKLRPGSRLKESQVQGIIHLVAGSVEQLEPDGVTVVDYQGKILAGLSGGSTAARKASTRHEMRSSLEQKLERAVQSMLEVVVGPGKAIVRVSAQLDFQEVERTEESYDPDSAAVRSEQRADEKSVGSSPLAAGVPGTAEGAPSVASAKEFKKSNETINYELNRTTKRIVEPSGEVRKLSVAVLLDGTYKTATNDDGEEVREYIPRSDEEMNKYVSIVRKAIGYDADRGDEVEVVNVPFETIEVGEDDKAMMERTVWIGFLTPVLRYGVVALGLAFFFLMVVRPVMGWLSRPRGEWEAPRGLPKTVRELEAEMPYRSLEESPAGNREQVQDLAKNDARQVAEALRRWTY